MNEHEKSRSRPRATSLGLTGTIRRPRSRVRSARAGQRDAADERQRPRARSRRARRRRIGDPIAARSPAVGHRAEYVQVRPGGHPSHARGSRDGLHRSSARPGTNGLFRISRHWLGLHRNAEPSSSTFPPTRISAAASPARRCRWMPGQLWLGTKAGGHRPEGRGPAPTISASSQAWDPATGKKVWWQNFPKSQLFGSVTATAGDLILVGGTNDRMFRAFHAKTRRTACGSRRPTPASWACRSPMRSTARSTSRSSPAGASTRQRIQDALATQNNIGIENNVPQGGVVWVFAAQEVTRGHVRQRRDTRTGRRTKVRAPLRVRSPRQSAYTCPWSRPSASRPRSGLDA